jgi:hypothetical protein
VITTKITKKDSGVSGSTEERLFKLLESMDWKLWEMYQILKAQTEDTKKPAIKTKLPKKTEE